VAELLAQAAAEGRIRRVCLQVTVAPDAFEQTLSILRIVKRKCNLPFDAAVLPRDLDQVRQLVEAGAEAIGFGLDAACERVYRRVKGGDWAHSAALIQATACAFPNRAALHLIVGLGETEREMVERIQWAQDLGVTVGLFAFTPVRGTQLEGRSPPVLATYRRMQAARWLIAHERVRYEAMTFDPEGCLTGLGAPLPDGGEPFRTSGCPDCNRPYYNERPGGVLYNYPRPLGPEEAARAVAEMQIRHDTATERGKEFDAH
jgi:biotin synthase